MSWGIEHFSNCHNELTYTAMIIGSISLWFKLNWLKLKTWITGYRFVKSYSINESYFSPHRAPGMTPYEMSLEKKYNKIRLKFNYVLGSMEPTTKIGIFVIGVNSGRLFEIEGKNISTIRSSIIMLERYEKRSGVLDNYSGIEQFLYKDLK